MFAFLLAVLVAAHNEGRGFPSALIVGQPAFLAALMIALGDLVVHFDFLAPDVLLDDL
jgi:hypothetical protein